MALCRWAAKAKEAKGSRFAFRLSNSCAEKEGREGGEKSSRLMARMKARALGKNRALDSLFLRELRERERCRYIATAMQYGKRRGWHEGGGGKWLGEQITRVLLRDVHGSGNSGETKFLLKEFRGSAVACIV